MQISEVKIIDKVPLIVTLKEKADYPTQDKYHKEKTNAELFYRAIAK